MLLDAQANAAAAACFDLDPNCVVCSTSSVCSVCKAVRQPRPLQARPRARSPARRCSRSVCSSQLLIIAYAAAPDLSLHVALLGTALLLLLWACHEF